MSKPIASSHLDKNRLLGHIAARFPPGEARHCPRMWQVDKGIIPLHIHVGIIIAMIMRGENEITMRIPDFDEPVAPADRGKEAAVR